MGVDFGGRRHVEKSKGRWKDDVSRKEVHVLEIRNWKETAKEREVWSKEIEEATAGKWAEIL
jgi:hypothetical protein